MYSVKLEAMTTWDEFTVEKAMADDLEPLQALRDDAARWLLSKGIDQWRPGQHTFAWERGDHHVFVLRRGEEPTGTVTILWEDPVIWGEEAVPAGYIHNLILARHLAGQGLGRRLLQWAEDYVAESGRSLARLDCGARNRKLRELYESVGYHTVRSQHYPWLGADRALALYEKGLRSLA